ncbi:MAG: YceI family protein [Crocinitomicaceae bacterium]|nr:YceI family protein [Flavobacteriales bacterium]NQZ37067.1 YceI family protein [Crocinitomicaceae bacterium]
MYRIFFIFLMIFPMIASAQSFNIETKKGTVNFTYDEGTKGTLGDVSATIKFDVSDLSKGSISGTVNVSTLDTKNGMRNKHLKGEDYFDSENYPTMTFESTSISESGGVFTIKGKLKIKTTEKEVIFKATNEEGKLLFTTVIYGLDYGVAISKKREKTKIEIFIEIPM